MQIGKSQWGNIGCPKAPPQALGTPKSLLKNQVPQSSSTSTRCPKAPPQPSGAPKPLHSHQVPQNPSIAPSKPHAEQDTLRSTWPPPQAWHTVAIFSSSQPGGWPSAITLGISQKNVFKDKRDAASLGSSAMRCLQLSLGHNHGFPTTEVSFISFTFLFCLFSVFLLNLGNSREASNEHMGQATQSVPGRQNADKKLNPSSPEGLLARQQSWRRPRRLRCFLCLVSGAGPHKQEQDNRIFMGPKGYAKKNRENSAIWRHRV